MAKKFSDLRVQVSPEARARVEVKAQKPLAEVPLDELCQAKGLPQKMLSEVLQVQQPTIIKMERRANMYISTLYSHVEAMGGHLEVTVRFPDGTVKISNSADIEETGAWGYSLRQFFDSKALELFPV